MFNYPGNQGANAAALPVPVQQVQPIQGVQQVQIAAGALPGAGTLEATKRRGR